MSLYFPNIDPTFVYKRKGDDNDPYMSLVESSVKVLNGKVILKEIPDFQSPVIVKNSSQIALVKTTNETLLANQFRVDYSVGIIFVHTSLEGQNISIEYKGTGYVSFPAERVWIDGEGAPVTLQNLADEARETIDNLVGTDVGSIESKIGSLTTLQTENKNSLTEALNEVHTELGDIPVVTDSAVNGNVVIDGQESVVYTHPSNHPASMITQDANNRMITDTERTLWNAKASTTVATTSSNGLLAKEDKVKLDTIDLANKVDGYTLQYDGATSKVVLKSTPEPSSNGGTSINDATTNSSTETWSTSKINAELDSKANSSHMHALSDLFEPVVQTVNGIAPDAEGNAAVELSEKVYYSDIAYEKYRDNPSSTDYYITHVPNLDKNGNTIKIKHGYQNDLINSGVGETARNFSKRHTTSLAVNASIWDASTGLIKGVQIQDGVIKRDVDGGTSHTLGIKADNTLVVFPPTTKASDILAAGCIDAVTGFFPMIQNSVAVSPAIYGTTGNPVEAQPRNVIAQLPNKDLLFLTCEGKTSANLGMTYADVIRILLTRGVTTAYCLDGGGSTQTVVRGVMINSPTDDAGKTERKVADFLYIEKSSAHKENIGIVSSDLGVLNKKVFDVARDLLTVSDDLLGLNRLPSTVTTIANLNSITKTNLYWCSGTATNAPSVDSSWGVLHIQAGATLALQIAFPFHATLGSIMLRKTNGDMNTWTAWRAM